MIVVARTFPYLVAASMCVAVIFFGEFRVLGAFACAGALVGVWISIYTAVHWELDAPSILATAREWLSWHRGSLPIAAMVGIIFIPLGAFVGFTLGLRIRALLQAAGYDA